MNTFTIVGCLSKVEYKTLTDGEPYIVGELESENHKGDRIVFNFCAFSKYSMKKIEHLKSTDIVLLIGKMGSRNYQSGEGETRWSISLTVEDAKYCRR